MRTSTRAADQPAQHIASTVVAGAHTIIDEHQGRANMVCDDAHTHIVLVSVPCAGARSSEAGFTMSVVMSARREGKREMISRKE